MITVSNGFKNSIKQLSVFSDAKIDIVNDDTTLSFDRDDIKSVEIFGTAFSNDKVLGNIAQHSLTLELLGDVTSNISLTQENICKVDIGVKVVSSYEYVRYQEFLITEIGYNDTTNVTKIIGTDYCVKLNKEYIDTNVYPITLKAYLEDVLSQCDLELENTTFLNDDFSIASRPINDYVLCKDVIHYVAELALCFVRVNKTSNKIELVDAFSPFMRGYTHTELSEFTHEELSAFTHYELMNAIGLCDETLTKDHYWNLKLSDYWFGQYGINTLTLGISQVEGENNSINLSELVAIDGVNEIKIVDNPFINSEALRLSVISDMFNVVKMYKYYPYTIEYRGFPYLELGDVIDIVKMNDTKLYSPIYEVNIRYDGGLYGKLNASALSKSETLYRNTQTLSQRVKQAEIIVDKVEGQVTIMAGDYYDGKLVGTYYNFDGDAFTITNADDEVVFSADDDGNLTLTGTIQQYKDDILRVQMSEEAIIFRNENDDFMAKTFTTFGWSTTTNESGDSSESWATINLLPNYETYLLASASIQSWGVYDDITSIQHRSIVSVGGNVSTGVYTSIMSASDNQTITSSIYVDSEGKLTLNSSEELYYIYIGGTLKTISVDGSGFLKAT
jgi:hypothetical protein